MILPNTLKLLSVVIMLDYVLYQFDKLSIGIEQKKMDHFLKFSTW